MTFHQCLGTEDTAGSIEFDRLKFYNYGYMCDTVFDSMSTFLMIHKQNNTLYSYQISYGIMSMLFFPWAITTLVKCTCISVLHILKTFSNLIQVSYTDN